MKRFRWLAGPLALASAFLLTFTFSSFGARLDRGVDLVTDIDTGRTWIADSHYAVRTGGGESVIMPRTRALGLIEAMNAGEIENYGYQDWRLSSVAELHRLLRLEATFGDLSELRHYLDSFNGGIGAITGRASKLNNDLVYAWPVRAQGSSDGIVLTVTNSLWVKRGNAISGDVVANQVNDPAGPNPTLVAGVEAQIDANTAIAGSLKADSIGNEAGASTFETLCNDIQGLGSLSCENLPEPLLFPIVGLPDFQPTSGDTDSAGDVAVAANQSTTLAAGTYRDITIGKNGSVCFAGGVYDIRSINGDSGSNLAFQSGADVRLDGQLILGSSPFIGADDGSFGCSPAGSANPTAAEIVFFIAGSDVTAAGGSIPAAAIFGAGKANDRGNLNANFYVGSAAMETGKDTDITGAIVARDFLMNRDSSLTFDSAFNIEPEPADPTADPQDVFTNGDENLEIVLTGSDPSGEDLTFDITSGPTLSVGAIIAGPTPILPDALQFCSLTHQPCTTDPFDDCPVGEGFCADTFCSVTRDQGCMVDGDCPSGETCTAQDFPPIDSASVTYDPVDDSNAPNSFEFTVTNVSLVTSQSAEVLINPGGDPNDPPDDPVGTVVAFDAAAEVAKNGTVVVNLRAEAPCDPTGATNPNRPCDGIGDDVPLTFSIVGGTPLTTADGGTVDNLVQGTGVPQRKATVRYSPATDFVHTSANPNDSFDFQACGFINAVQVCDTATATVVVVEPVPLAEDIGTAEAPLEVQVSAETEINLIGNSGGAGAQSQAVTFRAAGKISFRAVGIADATAAGSVTDSDGDGDGDVTVGPRNVAVLENTADLSSPSLDNAAADLSSFYNGLTNVSSSLISGTVTSLSGVGVFAVPIPDDAFSAGEISVMSDFLAGGGTIIFMGENQASVFDTANNAINSALSSLGSNMSIVAPGVADAGTQTATVANLQILSDPLTSGVNNFDYAAPSGVSAVAGGTTSLFLLTDLTTTFVAKESVGGGLIVLSGDSNIINTGGSPIPADNGVFFQNLLNPATVTAGFDGLAERRIQIEFDILDGLDPNDLSSARVTLQTVKGASDSLDTFFFAGNAEQDGVVTPSDFQASAQEIQGVVMPASGAVGTEDSFDIDVLSAVIDAINGDPASRLSVFSIQGRVDRSATGQGLSVRTDVLPVFEFSTPPPIFIPPLVFSIISIPAGASLLDSNGAPVMLGEPLPSPQVTLVTGGTTGSTSFTYQVEQAGIIGTGTVFLLLLDNCAEQGRPPGCSPGS